MACEGWQSQVIIFFLFLCIFEWVTGRLRHLPTIRANDCLHSLSAALISALPRLLVTSLDTALYSIAYHAMYKNTIADDSSFYDWFFVFLATDFGYYWFHRAAHEINLLWAAHQVHHSSEDYNISVSLRQSVVQQFVTWIFYLPLVFMGISPATLKTHLWFSCLYQIWTHTEVVDNLGPLEYIFVTPSHHRVHHGRNPYCIDRNYGGVLIIWDRIFDWRIRQSIALREGTFAKEQKDIAPVYGLVVERVNHWNPVWTQISHYSYLLKTLWITPGITNKLCVLLNGPSWSPGKPRLGDGTHEEVEYPIIKYNKTLPLAITFYVIGHFLLVVFLYYKHLEISESCSVLQTISVIAYLLFALTAFGTLFDHKWYGPIMEGIRCIAYLILEFSNNKIEWKLSHEPGKTQISPTSGFIQSVFIISLTIWFIVETMKINWTGSETKHHESKIEYFGGKQFSKYEQNNNTISQTDMIYLQYTK